MTLSNELFEKVVLDKWYEVRKKDIESPDGLHGNSILHVHGSIHKEKVIVSINPSF
jgi:hypothetical protein